MKNISNGLGKKLREARKARNVSLAKLSKEIKVNSATLSRIESGHDFHVSTAVKIIMWIEKDQ